MSHSVSQVLPVLLLTVLGPQVAAFAAEAPTQTAPPPAAAAKRLLIVTPPQFAGELAAFVEHKQSRLPVEVLLLDKVLREQPGVDDPERLKRALYQAWRERDVRYVLLVGDADVFPVRYMVLDRVTPAAFDYAFYPSDLYYADVAKADGSFENWNACQEGFHAQYYGEVRGEKNKTDPINFDRIHYRPELAVGRWPVSTPEEVRTVVAKTIAYEKRVLGGGTPAPRVGLIATGGWVDSRRLMDRVAQALPATWTKEKRFYASPGREPTTPPPTEKEVLQLLDTGVDLLLHAGHGTDTSWNECLHLAKVKQLKNAQRLPVLVSAGCSTARFATLPPYEPYLDVHNVEHKGSDAGEVFKEPPPPPAAYQKGRFNPPGLGEQLVRQGPNGAVAYIGCNTGSQPCGLTLLQGFAKAWGEAPAPRLGDCWAQAVSFYYDQEHLETLKPNADWYPPSIFFQGMKFMLYGDPSLRLPR